MLKVPTAIEKLNMYVQHMTHHAGLDENYEGTLTLTDVAAASTNAVLDNATLVNSVDLVFDVPLVVDPNFGRNITVATADAAGTLTVYGRDYLNQPMTEDVVVSANTGVGDKAFKFIDRVSSPNLAGNLDIGIGDELGIPFVGVALLREYVNGAVVTNGTYTAADAADPDATTGDVRGTYDPVSAPNGATDYVLKFRFNPDAVDGLYGREQA